MHIRSVKKQQEESEQFVLPMQMVGESYRKLNDALKQKSLGKSSH